MYGKRGQPALRAMIDGDEPGPSNGPGTAGAAAIAEADNRSERESHRSERRSNGIGSRHSSVSSRSSSRHSSEYGSAHNLSYYEDFDDRSSSGSASTVGHRTMRVCDEMNDAPRDLPFSEYYSRLIPFYWTNVDYEIGFNTMPGEMTVALVTAYKLFTDDEVVVRIVEPGFDCDDALGLVQLFYGYDQELLREFFAEFVFNHDQVKDCATVASSDEEWQSPVSRSQRINTALYADHVLEDEDPWGLSDSEPEWVQQVLAYGSKDPYTDSESESYSEHGSDADVESDDEKKTYLIEKWRDWPLLRATSTRVKCEEVKDDDVRESLERKKRKDNNPNIAYFRPEQFIPEPRIDDIPNASKKSPRTIVLENGEDIDFNQLEDNVEVIQEFSRARYPERFLNVEPVKHAAAKQCPYLEN
ncbi:hypothetical protein C8J56DRAFT_897424 [Mycena floridula]|nr:hypothetical protein C8J56DRAFT_897424 [Mycena floridula]